MSKVTMTITLDDVDDGSCSIECNTSVEGDRTDSQSVVIARCLSAFIDKPEMVDMICKSIISELSNSP